MARWVEVRILSGVIFPEVQGVVGYNTAMKSRISCSLSEKLSVQRINSSGLHLRPKGSLAEWWLDSVP